MKGNISQFLDGHNSHVTLEVVMRAMEVGLDILTLPFYTSHHLQALDVSIFAPFKKDLSAIWMYG